MQLECSTLAIHIALMSIGLNLMSSLTKVISYLNVPYDLSKVIFVATANKVQPIPPPLLDRMEVIELPGYTPEEKARIAMQYLIPRVMDQHGLSSEFLQISEVVTFLIIFRFIQAHACMEDFELIN